MRVSSKIVIELKSAEEFALFKKVMQKASEQSKVLRIFKSAFTKQEEQFLKDFTKQLNNPINGDN